MELGIHVSGRKLERWVPDDPESFKIGLAVYTQYRRVTDRQTDRHATTAKTARIKMRKMRVRKTVNARTFIQAEIHLFQFFLLCCMLLPCNFGNKDSQKAHHNLTIAYINSIYYSIHEVVEDVRFGCRKLCMLMFKKYFARPVTNDAAIHPIYYYYYLDCKRHQPIKRYTLHKVVEHFRKLIFMSSGMLIGQLYTSH